MKLEGRYRFDGAATYMLTPRAGGYCNLTVHADGTALRVEAAGNETRMRKLER